MTDQPIQSAPFPDEGPDLHIGSNGPECPHCGSTTSAVKDSRPYRAKTAMTKRRRLCNDCGKRFTTYESALHLTSLPTALRQQITQIVHQLNIILEQSKNSEGLP